jgi:uncharacterized surface protein with fasciclin (FAS1) repeats
MSRSVRSRALPLGAALLFLTACAPSDAAPAGETDLPDVPSNRGQAGVVDENSTPNILRVAIGSPDHTTLVAGVQAAELENVLVNAGPLTVFAPTDAAFAELPEGTLDELLKPENKSQLGKIITSHAAPAKLTLEMLEDGDQVYMATGHYVDVEVRDDGTYVNGSKILGTVMASNGVVHVVDKVWLIAAN